MAQTIGEALNECRAWEYSKEAFELTKEAYSLSLMGQYIENIEFAMYANNIGSTFTEGYLFEARDAEGKLINPMQASSNALAAANKEAGKSWKEWWGKFLDLMKKLLNFLISPFKALWQKTLKLVTTIQYWSPVVLAVCGWDFAKKTAKAAGGAIKDVFDPDNSDSIKSIANDFGKSVESYASDLADAIGPVGAISTAITRSGDIKLSNKAGVSVISKMFLNGDQSANKTKLYNILLDIYKESGLADSGKPGLSFKQPDCKLYKQLVKVANIRQSPSQIGNDVELPVLLYAALTLDTINIVPNGQDLISMEDLTRIFNNCNKDNGKMSKDAVTTDAGFYFAHKFRQDYNNALDNAKKNIAVSVDADNMKDDQQSLESIKNTVMELIAANNNGSCPAPSNTDFKNAQYNLQALGDLHKIIPNIILTLNNVVNYRAKAIVAINNFFTEAVGKNEKGEVLA